jgi:hypothetical protein
VDDAHVTRRSSLLIAALVGALVAMPVPASAADPVGPNQFFAGLVNGQTPRSSIRVACLGPIRPGMLGRPVPGQTVMVRRASSTDPIPVGFTGSAARSIVAFFSPSASNDPTVMLTEYGVAVAIPTNITVPCSGTGQVFFFAVPSSPTARSTSVAVTFTSGP